MIWVLPAMPAVLLPGGTALFRCYDTTWGYDEFNSGFGDTRFAPFDEPAGGRVPALYAAGSEIAALLETVFHEVHHQSSRHIFEQDLRRRALAHLTVPSDLWLLDVRDDALTAAGVRRDELVSTASEHYPCTRRIARDMHARIVDGRRVQGVLWHSRQQELLSDTGPVEVCVVFGDTFGTSRGSWPLTGPGARNLFEGPGRVLIDSLANELGATVQPVV